VERYTIGNRDGAQTSVMLATHRQHIWHTSIISVSPAVAARLRRELGEGPYTNPRGNFGQAQNVVLEIR
jgi:hypothetical protein